MPIRVISDDESELTTIRASSFFSSLKTRQLTLNGQRNSMHEVRLIKAQQQRNNDTPATKELKHGE